MSESMADAMASEAASPFTPALEVRGVHKSFGATRALRGIDLSLYAGRVHALLGANGCGKSTLVKTLAGYHLPDEGEIVWPESAQGDRPIAFVHQDLGLVPTLTVTENFGFTAGFDMQAGSIRWKHEHAKADATLQRYGIGCRGRDVVAALGPAEQTMVAIARALSALPDNGGVLILDEPTARLPVAECNRLIAMLQGLKKRNVAILYISHRLDEVMQLADDVTVLRDGSVVHRGPVGDLTRDKMVELIVGHAIDAGEAVEAAETQDAQKPVVIETVALRGVRVRDVSLRIREGEIVGIAGLVGSGRSELGRLLFGLQAPNDGTVMYRGTPFTHASTAECVRQGMAYVPQERKSGLFLGMSVQDNAVLADLSTVTSATGILSAKVRGAAEKLVRELRVKTAGVGVAIDTLSGGNQQKVSLGKWLRRDIRLLILDEPTQGIDIGARTEIFEIIRRMARERGIAALVLDSDLEILTEHCDRVAVMAHGRLVSELSGQRLTLPALNHAVFGN
jgi:ribose transport system ATP-binding protein